jgi:hypothetical protein
MSWSTKSLDRASSILLLVGSALHFYGSISFYKFGTQELVWALSESLAGALIYISPR